MVTLGNVVRGNFSLILVIEMIRPLQTHRLFPRATSHLTLCTQLLPRCRPLVHHLGNHHHGYTPSHSICLDLSKYLAGNLQLTSYLQMTSKPCGLSLACLTNEVGYLHGFPISGAIMYIPDTVITVLVW